MDWVLAVIDIHYALREFSTPVQDASTPKFARSVPAPRRAAASSERATQPRPPPHVDVTASMVASKPWAESVGQIRKKDLVELKSFTNPPELVRVVLSTVCWLLTGEGSSDPHYSWRLQKE